MLIIEWPNTVCVLLPYLQFPLVLITFPEVASGRYISLFHMGFFGFSNEFALVIPTLTHYSKDYRVAQVYQRGLEKNI